MELYWLGNVISSVECGLYSELYCTLKQIQRVENISSATGGATADVGGENVASVYM